MNHQIHQIIAAMNAEMNPEFYKGLVKIFHELRISLPSFHDQLDYDYLDYIYEKKSKKRCDLLTYSRLGKYKVDMFLKSKREQSAQKGRNRKSSFTDFLVALKGVSSNHKDNTLPFSGKTHFVTFTALFEESGLVNDGYTAKAVKEALIEAGCIEELTNKKIKFISSVPRSLNSNKDSIRQASDLIHRYSENMVHNRNLKKGEIKLFEKSILSTEIPVENIDPCFIKLNEHFMPQYLAGQEIIDSYETPNVESTYDVGFHIIFFKTERGEK
ncbi:MAG: hypothetical protein L3J52_05510 [Proteobacteria bacterium]|nr:hypothetical protein [Pseudomonadota bacterium]